MMDLALAGSAFLMGLAGTPHCLAMCGAACVAIAGGQGSLRATAGFHLGRLISYSAGGAVVAASVSIMGQLGQSSAFLRPLWVLVHLAAMGLGLFLLWQGRQPAWLEGVSRSVAGGAFSLSATGPALRVGAVLSKRPRRALLAGLAWVAWPCGLLQSALVVAALGSGSVAGAGIMAAFALGSSAGLIAGPQLLGRLLGWSSGQGTPSRWAVRLAGLALTAASVWALGHGVWIQIVEFCR